MTENATMVASLISTSLHLKYETTRAQYVRDILQHAIALRDCLSPLYPLNDSEWERVLLDIGRYSSSLM